MAKREALRELQSRLAERLQATRQETDAASWLAIEAAGHGLLLPLAQAGEIFALPAMAAVPHTHPWFLGVANLRGRLHGVVDLAAFLGLRREPLGDVAREQCRLVAFNPSLELNCAVLVDRLAGLRSSEQIRAEANETAWRPAFAGFAGLDPQGRRWQEIQLAALATDPQFMKIAR
ncbi:MAG TPA: chemotaxis protein CheW [Methylibium sp.]|uniref:chemotaxis protein CheW n=1 Tax=Methylibium sp. TaxID=2067992 RepID=UPI002DBD5304|nr:chemotaxis protein CheW [Methylibium sp.]HEU4457950.1 chemotaxis protein CheW [Methylibium sp.]